MVGGISGGGVPKTRLSVGGGGSQTTMCTVVTTTKAVVYPTIALNSCKLLLFLCLWKRRGNLKRL